MLIQGTPWHVTTGDTLHKDKLRRHKYSCKYYYKKKNHCTFCGFSCIGSSHCDYFKLKDKNDLNKIPVLKRIDTRLKNIVNERYNIFFKGYIYDEDLIKLIKGYIVVFKLKGKNLKETQSNKVQKFIKKHYKIKYVPLIKMNEYFYKSIKHNPDKLEIIFDIDKFTNSIIDLKGK